MMMRRDGLKKRAILILCVTCVLATGCQTKTDLTASGSHEWSRGVIVGSTDADPVAATTWGETTFVAWIAENGRVQLAQLDAALNLESVTDLALTAAYPYKNMSLEAEAADRLHVAWLDSIAGVRTIIYARLSPGETEPAFRQEIRLPEEIEHVQFVMRLEAQRLEIFLSADERRDSGIYHQVVDLASGEAMPAVRLTEMGWQPAIGWGRPGAMQVAWLEAGRSGYVVIRRADLDPEKQSLDNISSVAQVRVRRGRRFLGPALGSAGAQTVVAWTVGWRHSTGMGTSLDFPTSEKQIAAGLPRGERGAAASITSDEGQYTIVSATTPDMDALVYPLTNDRVVEVWQSPRMRTVGDRTWAFFSAWVAQRGSTRMQIVVMPFDANGPGKPVVVAKTRPSSVWPDLAVSADGTLRAAWVEPLGNDMYRVVVASTTPEARKALGGFRLAEVGDEAATFVFEKVSLLGYAPYMIGWMVLPLGALLLATFLTPGHMQGWKATAWLIVAIVLQLASKWFLAPQMLPFKSGFEGVVLSVTPIVLGISLMWIYWRRAREPILLAAYGLFIGADVVFSVFVMVPRLLWGSW